MRCRKPELHETRKLTEIHEKAFHDFFLTELGTSFLNTYYKSVLKTNESIAVCALNDNGEVVGFTTGCSVAKGYNQRLLLKNSLPFMVQAIRLIFLKPIALLRLLRNFEKNSHPEDDGNYAELFSIAVLPEKKGSGIGKALIKQFEEEANVRGCKKITLTTDFYNNDSVIEFYQKNGYHVFYDFVTYPNRRMYKMIKYI